MEFRTIVNLPSEVLKLTPASHVVLAGSCFTEHIGRRMSDALPKGHVVINPNGVLYNPGSVFTALYYLLHPEQPLPEESYFEGRDGLWRNWFFSGDFAAETLEECRQRIEESQEVARKVLFQADALFLTLSTDHCYFLHPDCPRESLVANCHKMPSRLFSEAILPFPAIVEEGNELLALLGDRCPRLQVIFTLSPYRYRKYGLHESQVSKARLMHAIDELCRQNDNACYFPTYEILNDELRDYRFYAPDMVHPSEQATDYVWERFREWAFTPQLEEYAHEKAALIRDFAHRPIHPTSGAAQLFLLQREKRKAAFLQKWGENLDF